MRQLWVVLAMCASCKTTKHQDEAPPGEPAVPSQPPETAPDRDLGSALPKNPHPDYPTAAAAGTDKLFFLEEPDRGPRAPTSYAPPPRSSLTWTTSPYCEFDPLGISCGKGAVPTGGVSWRVGRGDGVMLAEQLYGERVHDTYVFLTAGGKPTKQLHIDESGVLDKALLFTTPGRFSGRDRDGANTLPGCGLFAYTQDRQQHLGELRCLQWLGEPMRDTAGVAVRRYSNDARGFTIEETRFGLDGAPSDALDGVHRLVHTRDGAGRSTLVRFWDAQGKRAVDTEGCSGTRYQFAASGRVAKVTCIDRSDTPVTTGDGVATEQFEYSVRNCVSKIRYFDAAGRVSNNHLGLHGYDYETDDNCLDLSQTCIGIKGTPAACGPGRPAKEVYTRDARGYTVSTRHFAADGTPTGDASYGVHELRYAYDDAGNLTESTCFDARGSAAVCGTTDFHGRLATFDDAGRLTLQRFIDEQRRPTNNMSAPQGRHRYDNYDHEVEVRSVDDDGKLVESAGAAVRHNLWDARHQLFGIQLFDAQGKPAKYAGCYTGATCPRSPWHAIRINRRASGAVVSNQFFDAEGQLIQTIDCGTSPCFGDD